MGNLEHLKLLRTDMEAKGWTISSFIFVYKNIKYVVLVKLFIGPIKRLIHMHWFNWNL